MLEQLISKIPFKKSLLIGALALGATGCFGMFSYNENTINNDNSSQNDAGQNDDNAATITDATISEEGEIRFESCGEYKYVAIRIAVYKNGEWKYGTCKRLD